MRQCTWMRCGRQIIIIYYMQNNQNPQCSKCQAHLFSLRMLHKERRPNLSSSLTMCRSKQLKHKKVRVNCPNYQGPLLNKDRLHATPTFILPSQKIEYLESARELLREHQKRVRQAEEDNDQLFQPKPRSKNMYCNVCRQTYQEYRDHIVSHQHKASIKNSEFNRDILKLTKTYQHSHTKELTVISTETGSIDDDSVEIIGATSKKIKTNPHQPMNVPYYPFSQPQQRGREVGPLMMPQPQGMYNPFGVMNQYSYYPFGGSMCFNPYSSLMDQGMRYPMYYPYQPLEFFPQR